MSSSIVRAVVAAVLTLALLPGLALAQEDPVNPPTIPVVPVDPPGNPPPSCDPAMDPNCPGLPPGNPPTGGVPPIPTPCSNPANPICTAWPNWAERTETCVNQATGAATGCNAHAAVLGQHVLEPTPIPVPNLVDAANDGVRRADSPENHVWWCYQNHGTPVCR